MKTIAYIIALLGVLSWTTERDLVDLELTRVEQSTSYHHVDSGGA